jgi:cell shape-determining protein MreD
MATLLAFPILAILLVLQTAILSQIPLLQGTTDLVLLALVAWSLQRRVRTAWQWGIIGGLLVGFVSAVPFIVFVVGYLLTVGISLLLRQRIWQVPLLAMFIATFFGTLVIQLATLVALRVSGTVLPLGASINLIILPSILLNLLLALPFFTLFSDLANFLYPRELEM